MKYLTGTIREYPLLGRFLPATPEGVARRWLQGRVEPGSWILDPFGTSPQLAMEAATSGYRLLTAANNPINRFLIDIHSIPCSKSDLQSALAQLAGSRVGDQRLEPYIQSLYLTECSNCEAKISAEAFIWNRDEQRLEAKQYSCPECGQNGEFQASQEDRNLARRIAESITLHRARALERVAGLEDPDRVHAEEALTVYTPRAVLALFSIINRLEGLSISTQQVDQIRLMMLYTLDRCNSLWAADGSRQRPKQLTIPGIYIERNVWHTLEGSLEQLASAETLSIRNWNDARRDPVQTGTIIRFEGPIRDLSAELNQIKLSAIVTVLPRPNQAYWTLSALWAGWLWGREAVQSLKSVLRRRRYDWNWHTSALYFAWSSLVPAVRNNLPVFGYLSESEPGFVSAVLASSSSAGLKLQGIAHRSQIQQSQFQWLISTEISAPTINEQEATEVIASAGKKFLLRHGEPVQYGPLHAAVLSRLVELGPFVSTEEIQQGQSLTQFNSLLHKTLTYQSGFLRYGAAPSTFESGSWWLREDKNAHEPMADRCERIIVNALITNRHLTYAELDELACEHLPGLDTPEPGLIEALLNSYAEKHPEETDLWQLRSEDTPRQRREDIQLIRATLDQLGKQLGFHTDGVQTLKWVNQEGDQICQFYFQASANISQYVLTEKTNPRNSIIVLPGGRANLVMYKIRRDPNLAEAVNQGWRFLKFRHVFRMAEDSSINADNFSEQLELDPLTYSASQIRMF